MAGLLRCVPLLMLVGMTLLGPETGPLRAQTPPGSYGVGRLTAPSTLELRLDGAVAWMEPQAVLRWDAPYTATNSAAVFL